jgi:RimJ/RimL family protein N-acetyltransferase
MIYYHNSFDLSIISALKSNRSLLPNISDLCNEYKPFVFLSDAFTPFWQPTPSSWPKDVWAVELEGQLVAGAGYLMAEAAPQLYQVGLVVAPAYQGHGIGSLLCERLCELLRTRGARRLLTRVYAQQHVSQRFLVQHGFRPIGSSRFYQLEVGSAQAHSDVRDDQAWLAQAGLRFATLERFPRQGLAERLLALWNSTRPDQPQCWPFVPYSAQRFEREMLEPPEVALAHSLALVGPANRIVGLALNAWLDAGHLSTIYLGIEPAFRRRGLATALKHRLIAHAQEQGIELLIAENDARNRPMHSINTRLGYRPLAELLVYEKLLEP